MGTSRRGTPPGARLAGPEGARTAYRGRKKRATRRLVSSGKLSTAYLLEIIQLRLANYKWIDRYQFNPRGRCRVG
jgi:hypothetical protein